MWLCRSVYLSSICWKCVGLYRRWSPIAQLVERVAVNRKVAGSNPAGRDHLFVLRNDTTNHQQAYFNHGTPNDTSQPLAQTLCHRHPTQQISTLSIDVYTECIPNLLRALPPYTVMTRNSTLPSISNREWESLKRNRCCSLLVGESELSSVVCTQKLRCSRANFTGKLALYVV